MYIVRIYRGWSGEREPGQWASFTVELDDDVDLRRVVRDAGLAEEIVQSLPVTVVYELLRLEAERLILIKLVDQGAEVTGEHRDRLAGLNRRKLQVTEGLALR